MARDRSARYPLNHHPRPQAFTSAHSYIGPLFTSSYSEIDVCTGTNTARTAAKTVPDNSGRWVLYSFFIRLAGTMKISHYIFLGFVSILILFSITTFVNFSLSNAVMENNDYFTRSTNLVRNSSRFQRNLLTMVNGLRGYLLTGEHSFVEAYDTANIENTQILKEMEGLITDSAQRRMLNHIKELNDQWTEEYTDPLKQAKMSADISREHLDTFNRVYKEKFASGHERSIQTALQQQFKAFSSSEYTMRDVRKQELAASVTRTNRLSLLLTSTSIILGLFIIIFVTLKISRRIRVMTDMANNIASGHYDVTISDLGKDELSALGNALNHMARQLSGNIALLKRSNAELDQFAQIVSHDLKGPLRGISNVVTWIDEDHQEELTPKMTEYMELIKGRVHRAENLIEGLLSYAKADKEEIEKEEVYLNALVKEAVDNLPDTGNVQVEIGDLPVVHAERLWLFQIFSNLISNAIKHNDKPFPTVKVYCKEQPDHYEFFIEDNGNGIEQHYHKRIFIIFQTLKDRDSFESTGVGLAIVKKIIDLKKQQINVSSSPGKGSVFSFTWSKE
ncbi:phospho-acceptor domain-containing protein [Chitinophaga ginsengisoli]|uniref:histidine kinase n=2 Tax=Chitinophaga ginsengisoli TaxID=363837 RepID=A0A2P8G9K0_9BACT|nr:phospho-acceptor domain-containing protein [Chitinophaga ginsengisoli]